MKRIIAWAGVLAALVPGLAARAAETGEGTGGLPQFDPSSYPSQIFWLVVFFAVLYRLFTRKALPRLGELLEERQDRIAADLDRATKLRAEAEETQARYERLLEEARGRAHETVVQAQERIARETAERLAELERSTQERIRAAEAEIARFKEQALGELGEAAADLVREAARRLVELEVPVEEARAAVARVLGQPGESRS